MKLGAILIAIVLPQLPLAQASPPQGGPSQGGYPQGGPGQRPPAQSRPTQSSVSPSAQTAATPEISATIQLLSRADVEKDLGMTIDQYKDLSKVAGTIANQELSEDSVRQKVATVLNPSQMARLTELLIQYLGYGALSLSDVRAKLNLTADQQTRISDVLTQLVQAKRTVRHSASNASAAQQAIDELQTQAKNLLGKVLNSAQDTALRTLAGQSLGSS